ncbi:MAG: PilZ domain-containing protein [Burkholderiales bacterium]|nr:PilZ domain-containing protein [Burkholderiales bacterium]
MPYERRHFVRVVFAAPAQLACNEVTLEVRVLDLSLKGALITLPAGASVREQALCTLTLPLTSGSGHIEMEMQVAHVEGAQLGLLCLHSDIDSITHLRRLIELQLGDPALLERDLRELVAGAG